MNKTTEKLLNSLLETVKKNSAFNIRENGTSVDRYNTENVLITSKKNKSGIDINIKKNTIGESVYIPVVVSEENINDIVYNDFYIGDNSIVTIYAGCIVHNNSTESSSHKGMHTFHLGKNSKVQYIEQHYGIGKNENKNINTDTIIYSEEKSIFIMKTIQHKGVNNAIRNTEAYLNKNALLNVEEKLLTEDSEQIYSSFKVELNGKDSACNISSKAVAEDSSTQKFVSEVIGNEKSSGHIECDAILMDKATVSSTPSVIAKTSEAILTHEAAIGKIAKEEITKLMTLGLTEKEAEKTIIEGFIN